MELIRPDRSSRCTWEPNEENTPHTVRTEPEDRKKILPNILKAIGQTPLVRLNNIPKSYGIKCEVCVKCEFLNPGGSVKDRIAYRMVQDAEDKGLLKPGYTIIEPTSGNTGIGLAMAAAVKGYRCIIVMPEKMSDEKVYTLRSLGAEIVRTPTEASWDSPEAHIGVSQKLQREIPNSVILDQYTNPGNPLAHYDQTATEIWNQCEGKVDYLVIGAGTGGTVSGVGRKLKELSPQTKVVGVDPRGSILAPSEESSTGIQGAIGFYEVEGIGYDFVPTVLDYSVIDTWIKTEDSDSLKAARMLIRQEGLLCGGSSGSALWAGLQIAKDLPREKRLVILLPDGIRNYMTKFVSDHWMETKGFLHAPCTNEANEWWWNVSIANLPFAKIAPLKEKTTTCEEAMIIFNKGESQQLAIATCSDSDARVSGIASSNSIMTGLISGSVNPKDFVERAMVKQFVKVSPSMTLGRLSRILEKELFAVVFDETRDNAYLGILNQSHILHFISRDKGDHASQ